ncbi:iron dicitrate transport regulator FecR [Sphingomonas sp. Leaf357]|uniref:SIS domain-containing protein n=1 Tax=Sphingomonas sp. Leaf357 TaxID=1736350 RepID=UPI0006FBCCC2|nr:SIS domain-containing protein [Sphingomonas sp. Leaf357]KQS05322.1 iron dicitrate transport regulator FecR [Sphingomonas sp. Leaf357]
MHCEAAEASAAVARMLAANRDAFVTLGARLRGMPPAVVVTCARGSSDHAATYGKYLIETLVGVPVASAAPSVSSVYAAPMAPGAAIVIAVSQSGRSPDLLATVEAYRTAGAYVIALVNDETSPLAKNADVMIALKAGPERSVAATKSYICALAAFAALAAEWADDTDLRDGLAMLPDGLTEAFALDWSVMVDALTYATNLFVIGRGYGYGIAQEAALKLKETCALHAEAFSAAEVRHGPMAIVGEGFPVIAFATSDMAGDGVRTAASEFAGRGAVVCLADASAGCDHAPVALAGHPAIEPILMIQSFYRMANRLSLRRGLDPDAPLHLSKVTRTV